MRRVTERSIYFGEAEAPDDIDELIMHRATLRGILDGTYWSGRGPLSGAVSPPPVRRNHQNELPGSSPSPGCAPVIIG